MGHHDVMVIGGTGATGQFVVRFLLERGFSVRVIVRSQEKFPEEIQKHQNISIIDASLLALTDQELAEHIAGCGAIISTLGHTMSFKGVFGKPRRLVTEAITRLCKAIEANRPGEQVKLILMNTSGNQNRDLQEPRTFGERLVIGMVRTLIPPQRDNELAADYLRVTVGQNHPVIRWVTVRPDTLINDQEITPWITHPSPVRSPIFNAGKVSRINVADFMVKLLFDQELWDQWQGKMPVLYNQSCF